jgi:hypothetical protein
MGTMAGAGRRSWGAACAVAGLIVVGTSGCSGSSGATGSDASTTTAATESTVPRETSTTSARANTTTTAGGGSVEELVAAALVPASDIGAGWTRESATGTLTSTNRMLLAVPACHDLVPDAGDGADAEATAQADYSTTTFGSALDVQYQVDRYAAPEDAAAVVQLVSDPGFGTCMGTALTSLADDATIGDVQVSPLTIPSASELGVDATAAVQATITVTSSGQEAIVLAQVVVLQAGGALGTFTVTSTSTTGTTPRPINLQATTVQAAATRLQALSS